MNTKDSGVNPSRSTRPLHKGGTNDNQLEMAAVAGRNGLRPWYWIAWGSVFYLPALLCLFALCVLVAIINLDTDPAMRLWRATA